MEVIRQKEIKKVEEINEKREDYSVKVIENIIYYPKFKKIENTKEKISQCKRQEFKFTVLLILKMDLKHLLSRFKHSDYSRCKAKGHLKIGD